MTALQHHSRMEQAMYALPAATALVRELVERQFQQEPTDRDRAIRPYNGASLRTARAALAAGLERVAAIVAPPGYRTTA
jgi:hypothetical protein